MDPVTALGVASSVVQLVNFGASLVSQAKRIYDSAEGALPEHIECKDAGKRLTELSENIKKSIGGQGTCNGTMDETSQALKHICNGCIEVSDELQRFLGKLRLEDGYENRARRKWRSFREALRSVSSSHDIKRLKTRLSSLRDELEVHLVLVIREQGESMTKENARSFSTIEESITKLVEKPVICQEDLRNHQAAICYHNATEHEKTRATILNVLSIEETSKVEDMLLNSLRFTQMRDRHQEISEAHVQTFKWILGEQDASTRPWSNFSKWLESGNGIYWMSGKAGSGKSTLMRYITEDPRTLRYLESWSGSLPLDTANFFFWNSGSTEQRSYVGLLRTLLYDILKRKTDLIALVFPEEWAADCSKLEQSRLKRERWELADRQWTLQSLKRAFKRLTSFNISGCNQCFFIDGLDEHEGDHESMIEFLKTVSTSPHIKFCLSSRPWLIFEDLFEFYPKLRLQDLTFDDIRLYVSHELEGHRRMRKLAEKEPEHASSLVGEIVSKAAGVFLWVTLVVKTLLNGLMNGDDIQDLRRRLRAFPAELKGFYAHILQQIEPLYRIQAFKTFKIYNAMSKVMDNVCGLELEAAIAANFQHALQVPVAPIDDDEIKRRSDRIEAHLKSRCAGLLEIHEIYDGFVPPESPFFREECIRFSKNPTLAWTRKKVVYLHQTVREFLEGGDSESLILQNDHHHADFEPYSQILISFVARLKQNLTRRLFNDFTMDPHVLRQGRTDNIHVALTFARLCDDFADVRCLAILDELNRAGTSEGIQNFLPGYGQYRSQFEHWSDYGPRCKRIEQQGSGFTGEAVHYGLLTYVSASLRSNDAGLIASGRSNQALLNCAFLPKPNVERQYQCTQGIDLKMLELLLKLGANPNQLWKGHTPWQRVLTLVHEANWDDFDYMLESKSYLENVLLNWVGVFELLLRYGASVSTTCMQNHPLQDMGLQTPCTSHTVHDVITRVFSTCLPNESKELEHMVREIAESSKIDVQLPTTLTKPNEALSGMKRIWKNEDENVRKRPKLKQ